jgi:hypothetical protein
MILLILVLSILIIRIIFLKLLTYKTPNKLFTNIIDPINYINYNDFKEKYKVNQTNVPIYVFYHLCPGNQLNIIDEQVNDLIVSGLYDKSEAIFYGCNCKNCDLYSEKYFEKYPKFKKLNGAICPNEKTYENMTLNYMLKFSKENPKFYGLYLHSKGTSSVSKAQHDWRKFMMYFLVRNYKICIDILNRNFYTCGLNYISILFKHYSGNFFWFDSTYLKNLDYIENTKDRMSAEKWLLSKYIENKHICLYDERYLNLNNEIKTGLYHFSIDYEKNIKELKLAIV